MSSVYRYKSGAEKRNERHESNQRDEKMLAKIPKLTSIFPTVTLEKSKPYEVKISTDICSSDPLSQSMDVQSVVTETAAEGTVDHLQTTLPAASPVSVYDTDLSKWPEVISQDMREYWTQCRSQDCQHPDVNFEASKIVEHERVRCSRFIYHKTN